jgi:hypothetical protein
MSTADELKGVFVMDDYRIDFRLPTGRRRIWTEFAPTARDAEDDLRRKFPRVKVIDIARMATAEESPRNKDD